MLFHKGSKDFCLNTDMRVSVYGPLTQVAHSQYPTAVHATRLGTHYTTEYEGQYLVWVGGCFFFGGGGGER